MDGLNDSAPQEADFIDDGGLSDAWGLDATDTVAETAVFPCTPGDDQTCNDDPSINGVGGTCNASGTCICGAGFSVNPRTGRCRLGNACAAAGADSWAETVRVASPGCGMRPASICRSTAGTADERLSAAVETTIGGECVLPANFTVRVELVAGCATLFELDHDFDDSSQLNCVLKVLSSVRWSCAAETNCVLYKHNTP